MKYLFTLTILMIFQYQCYAQCTGTPPDVPVLTVTNTGCGNTTGSITVTAPAGGSFEYSIDNINWQASPEFSGKAAGTYTVSVRLSTTINCISSSTATIRQSVCGHLFSDANGILDNIVNGTGTDTGNTIYAILYDNTTHEVADVITINPDGTFELNAVNGHAATLYISTTIATIGQTAEPVVTPPTGWVSTGEYNCITSPGCSGHDNSPDGILSLGTVNSAITEANFGIYTSVPFGAIDVSKTSAETYYAAAGDVINYYITVTNTGTVDLTSIIVTDPGASSPPVFLGTDPVLNPGESWVYVTSYTVTQADIDNCSYTNIATVVGSDPGANLVTGNGELMVPALPDPDVEIVKTAMQTTYNAAGNVINYTITVTNTGNSGLLNVIVSDPLSTTSPVYQSGDDGNNILNVGEVWTYTASYVITAADVTNGSFLNTANVSADSPCGNQVSKDDNEEVTYNGPLPVRMLSLDAIPEKSIVHLKWATTSENNSDRFEIEHSMDAVHWAPAGVVSASGESSVVMKYSFTHTSPEENINYYRLKIIDLDGTYAYSKPVHAIISESAKPATSIRIYPNPVSDRLYLTGKTSGISSFEILDLNGKKVLAGPYEPSGIKTGGLTEGSYLIRFLKNNNKSETFRIVIRK